MSFPALEQYLSRLHAVESTPSRVRLDANGRVQGRYFNTNLTTAFQAIRDLRSQSIAGYEGFARSYTENDQGLFVWRLLENAASDEESVELDRLCRMLHALNFFRQPAGAGKDLYLSVHGRLLTAVQGNHGMAFKRVLDALDLPQERIVLQLPVVSERQDWLLSHVAHNYRNNGFRVAINAADAARALALVERIRPEAVKVDVRDATECALSLQLLSVCEALGVRVIFKRIENAQAFFQLREFGQANGVSIAVQGFLWGLPHASLAGEGPPFAGAGSAVALPRAEAA
ncbi:MAG TPA: EAL domain-containing protein [Noviherbaspirillum sp.]|jgi:EAL domain-containing protein (putative c-di-GMP-specific phosphodiesterase class I)|nr:EAL domain-containing protein [Noviherbaspirillum sp.]